MAVIDVVEAPNQGANELVVRVPQTGSGDFKMGSQVIVRESQTAVFFRDGKALDKFSAGRHTITTANIPLLTNLLEGLLTGGRNVFTAEVYFVNMREFLDLKWGTSEPVTLRDKDLGMARLRAFGNFSMQINDPQLFVNKIVGTQGIYQTSQIEGQLRSIVVSRLTDVLGEAGVGLLDLPSMFDEIGGAIRAKVLDDFAALGIALKQFFVQSISPTEETQKAIDERASMGAIGNMQAYMQYKAAQALGTAAASSGEAGSAVGTGLGLGAGVGLGGVMAQMMGQAMSGTQQPAAGAPSAPDVMTVGEAAAYLKAKEQDIIALIDGGELKAKKIGSEYRISKSALDAYLNA